MGKWLQTMCCVLAHSIQYHISIKRVVSTLYIVFVSVFFFRLDSSTNTIFTTFAEIFSESAEQFSLACCVPYRASAAPTVRAWLEYDTPPCCECDGHRSCKNWPWLPYWGSVVGIPGKHGAGCCYLIWRFLPSPGQLSVRQTAVLFFQRLLHTFGLFHLFEIQHVTLIYDETRRRVLEYLTCCVGS